MATLIEKSAMSAGEMRWRPDGDTVEIRNGKGNVVFATGYMEMMKFMSTVSTLRELQPPETENLELFEDNKDGKDADPGV
jgi:hypothetical protein